MQSRTVQQKIGDTHTAFEALREVLTPDPMRALIGRMSEIGSNPDEKVDIAAYASLVNGSLALARIVAANDRAAMLAAAMITQTGVSRPVFNTESEEL